MRTKAYSRDFESNVERHFIEMNAVHDRIRTRYLVQHRADKSESAVVKEPAQKAVKSLSKGAAV